MLETDNDMRALTLLLILFLPLPIAAFDPALMFGQEVPECPEPNKDRKLSKEELSQVLYEHNAWLEDTSSEERTNQRLIYSFKCEIIDPRRAILLGANLTDADLKLATLSGADLSRADLSGADLAFADLTNAKLFGAKLTGAKLIGVNIAETDSPETNLGEANLSGADLTFSDLSGADLRNADLTGAIYEPKEGKHPRLSVIATVTGLSELTYDQPRALAELRKLFKDGGYRNQERQITRTIHQVRTEKLLSGSEGLPGRIEGAFNYVFFELTTKWGLVPSRALSTIAVLIIVFSLAYVFALRSPTKDGIWRIWSSERIRDDLGNSKPELLALKGFSSVKLAFYFSLLSAFHIGWRDLNVGNWITRVQPREYTLSASGWVRTVSGIQSLLSVYLLAIWVLTYFGRPFE